MDTDPDADPDSDPDADPDPSIFIIDLKDANKKIIVHCMYERMYCTSRILIKKYY
jgi:hypothetical protein